MEGKIFLLRDSAKFIIWHSRWVGEEKFLQKDLLAPYAIIAKTTNCPFTLSLKMYVPRIHWQQMLYCSDDEFAKDHTKFSFLQFLPFRVFGREKIDHVDEETWLMDRSCKQWARKFCFSYKHFQSISHLAWFTVFSSKWTTLYFKLYLELVKCLFICL